MTMLRAAVRSWRDFSRHWANYCEEEDELPVRPILVVQVQDASGNQISKTDISEVINVIEAEADSLPAPAFAHALHDSGLVEIGGRNLRYLAPPDIDADPEVRVIFSHVALGPHGTVVSAKGRK